jgi:hypothetical protein
MTSSKGISFFMGGIIATERRVPTWPKVKGTMFCNKCWRKFQLFGGAEAVLKEFFRGRNFPSNRGLARTGQNYA